MTWRAAALRLLEVGDERLAASVAREADRQRRRGDELQRRIAINVTIERARVRGDLSDRLLRTLESVLENFEMAERATEEAAAERGLRNTREPKAASREGI